MVLKVLWRWRPCSPTLYVQSNNKCMAVLHTFEILLTRTLSISYGRTVGSCVMLLYTLHTHTDVVELTYHVIACTEAAGSHTGANSETRYLRRGPATPQLVMLVWRWLWEILPTNLLWSGHSIAQKTPVAPRSFQNKWQVLTSGVSPATPLLFLLCSWHTWILSEPQTYPSVTHLFTQTEHFPSLHPVPAVITLPLFAYQTSPTPSLLRHFCHFLLHTPSFPPLCFPCARA